MGDDETSSVESCSDDYNEGVNNDSGRIASALVTTEIGTIPEKNSDESNDEEQPDDSDAEAVETLNHTRALSQSKN